MKNTPDEAAGYTPGPWVSPWDLPEDATDEDFSHFTAPDGESVIGVGWWDGPYLAVSRENACLIAAAPDLLKALESIVVRLDGDGPIDYTDVAQARVAIARAKGVQARKLEDG